ncbi:MAG: hypothetical protein K6T83_16490 [Alicyclobacillus sp.]|nr:hypothetical protein [Alicyclobacillus sp.]
MATSRITVFCEYRVAEEKRAEYLWCVENEYRRFLQRFGAEEVLIYTGVDQPGLFVEEFTVPDMEVYGKVKDSRFRDADPVWEKLHACVPGGKEKVHMWAFAKV